MKGLTLAALLGAELALVAHFVQRGDLWWSAWGVFGFAICARELWRAMRGFA